jgi:hypothetical protein
MGASARPRPARIAGCPIDRAAWLSRGALSDGSISRCSVGQVSTRAASRRWRRRRPSSVSDRELRPISPHFRGNISPALPGGTSPADRPLLATDRPLRCPRPGVRLGLSDARLASRPVNVSTHESSGLWGKRRAGTFQARFRSVSPAFTLANLEGNGRFDSRRPWAEPWNESQERPAGPPPALPGPVQGSRQRLGAPGPPAPHDGRHNRCARRRGGGDRYRQGSSSAYRQIDPDGIATNP